MIINKPKKIRFLPEGFKTYSTSCGIKDNTLDLGVVYSDTVCQAAALFTKNKIQGNPIKIGKKHIQNGRLQSVVVNSKNANVATGRDGLLNSMEICRKVANELSIPVHFVFPSSTGIIKVGLPIDKIKNSLTDLKNKLVTPPNFSLFAKSIMTTDTFPKFTASKCGSANIVGIAKGAGMIEPNMATMLAYFFTDAFIPHKKLKKILSYVTSLTFNSLSVDTDMSTSDTVLALANGKKGKVDLNEFQDVLLQMATQLTKWIASDGEGATKLFITDVIGAKNNKEAFCIAKSIINSPLVKTAIYKGDPNWGRIYMAIGKVMNANIIENKIRLYWGEKKIEYSETQLKKLSQYLRKSKEVYLTVDMNIGKGKWRVYGCDLTEEYVRINSLYST